MVAGGRRPQHRELLDLPDAAQRLQRAGIAAAVRGGRLRVSCHVYNSAADVDAALDAIAG